MRTFKFSYFFILISILFIAGCYSFTGGSIPEHLKTLQIAPINDNSGFGDPRYKDYLTKKIIEEFQRDNSFQLVEFQGDAKLTITISSIRDDIETVKPGELEKQRRITITCNAEYFDAVKKKSIWQKSFSSYDVYELANFPQSRDKSIYDILDNLAQDILLAVVSGW